MAETWHLNRDSGQLKRDLITAFDGKHKLTKDRIKQTRKLTEQGGERNLIDEFRAPHLERAMDRYLEANSATHLED